MVTLVLDLESSLLDSIPAIAASLCHGINEACGAAADEARIAELLRSGQLEALRASLGERAFRAALRRGAAHYQRVGQFMAWPYIGVPAMLSALSKAGIGVVLVSRTPRATLERIIDRWGLELHAAHFDCPTLPAPAQDRRERLAALVTKRAIDVRNATCLSDDPLDLECAEHLGIRPVFAAYGRLAWQVCRWDAGSVALSPDQVPRLVGMRHGEHLADPVN